MKQMTETMQLVTFQDGDKYGEPITNSLVIAAATARACA